MTKSKDVLLLTTTDRPREYTDGLKRDLEKDLNCNVDIFNLEDLEFQVIAGSVNIFHKASPIGHYNAVYIKHWHAQEEAALVVSTYFGLTNIPVVPNETSKIVPKTKFGETFLLAMSGLPVPDSIYFNNREKFLENYTNIVGTLGTPFIFKAVDGKKGASNYLVSSHEELKSSLEESNDHNFIAQKFIDNDGDFRIINFGNELKIAIYRTRSGDTHLNNTSQGGDGELVDLGSLSEELKEDCLAAAMILGRDISGIDVVIGKDGKHYIFEINYSPQLTTGTFLDIKRHELSEYFRALLS